MINKTEDTFVISFTGTRSGLTDEQKERLFRYFNTAIDEWSIVNFVHGDCVGADADAHDIAASMDIEIFKRPCDLDNQRAYTEGGKILSPPEPPLDRNRKIINDGDVLIACPDSMTEKRRSGTWSTVRYARSISKNIVIIYPDGSTMGEVDEN